jgi:hypothetical protein
VALPSIGSLGTNVEGSSTSLAIPLPSGVVNLSGVLALVFLDSTAQTMTWPGGWQEAENSPINVSPTSHGLHVAWHRASGSESGNVTPTWTSSTFAAAFTARIDNMVTSGTPFDSPTGSAHSAGSNVTVSPTVSTTTLGADRLLIHVVTNWSGGTFTADTSPVFTKQQQSLENVMVLCTRDQASAGGSGDVEATCTGSDKSTAWIGGLIGTTGGGAGTSAILSRRPRIGALLDL